MKTNSEIRRESRAKLKGNWVPCILVCLVYLACMAIVETPSSIYGAEHPFLPDIFPFDLTYFILGGGSSLVTILLIVPISVGIYNAFFHFWTDGDRDLVHNMFHMGFRNYTHVLGGQLLACLFVFLWSLLLLIPGIIKDFAYACVPYLLVQEPELGLRETLRKSEDMMRGHKMDFFLMCLGFVGLCLLGFLTLGIALIWILPYICNTSAGFYAQVKEEYESRI